MILGQYCYHIHHPFEFKKSEGKTTSCAVSPKYGWALSGPLPLKQAAALPSKEKPIADDKLPNQLSKWWDIEPYASIGHSKDEPWENKSHEIGRSTAIQRWKIQSWRSLAKWQSKVAEKLLLCDVQRKSLERRQQKKTTLKKRCQEKHQIALSVNIEAKILQIAVPTDDCWSVWFLFRED